MVRAMSRVAGVAGVAGVIAFVALVTQMDSVPLMIELSVIVTRRTATLTRRTMI